MREHGCNGVPHVYTPFVIGALLRYNTVLHCTNWCSRCAQRTAAVQLVISNCNAIVDSFRHWRLYAGAKRLVEMTVTAVAGSAQAFECMGHVWPNYFRSVAGDASGKLSQRNDSHLFNLRVA